MGSNKMIERTGGKFAFLIAVLTLMASAVLAQSPNTASIVVTVVDQNDAVVNGANVSVVNTATGATREAVSNDEGTATIARPFANWSIQSECCDDRFHCGRRDRPDTARRRNCLSEDQANGKRRQKRSYCSVLSKASVQTRRLG